MSLLDLFSKHALWAYWHVTDITLLPNGLTMPNNPGTVNAIHILLIHILTFCFWNGWIHEFGQRYPIEIVWVIFQLSKWGYRFLNWVYESYITFDCVFGQRTTWRNSFDQVETVIRTREKWKIQFETDDKSNLSLCFNWRATIICLLLRQTWRNKSSEGKHMHTST